MKQKVKYRIEPRIKKRWFKENELYYDLIKTEEKGSYVYNGIDSDWIEFEETRTVLSSKDINEVLTVIENLKTVNEI